MHQSLSLGSPPSVPFKRQRSCESRDQQARPGDSSQGRSATIIVPHNESEVRPTIRMPAFLYKERSEIITLFQELEWKQRFRLSHAFKNPKDSPFRVDRSPAVIDRNRYGNVQPWDASRVKLKTPIGGSDYVNASPIMLKSKFNPQSPKLDSTPTHVSTEHSDSAALNTVESKYIATQGPKEGQFAHFWSMVMQEIVGPVGVIIMLTQCYEGNKEKCSQYFPRDLESPSIPLPVHEDGEGEEIEDTGDPFTDPDPLSFDTDDDNVDYDGESGKPNGEQSQQTGSAESEAQLKVLEQGKPGSITLHELHYDKSTACEIRRMELRIGEEKKEIYHYLFKGWPDFGKPEAEDRRALVELTRVSRVRATEVEGSGQNPRFVHCSAGVGRTGTFIALDFLINELQSGSLVAMVQLEENDAAVERNGKTTELETRGKSGPLREKDVTPDPKDKGDLIYETVNTLREQRMMMVMNDVQYSFLYEVVREVFVERYSAKEEGIKVAGPAMTEEPTPKVPKIDGGGGGGFGAEDVSISTERETSTSAEAVVISYEDPTAEGDGSEAETEIMDDGVVKNVPEATVDDTSAGNEPQELDPYHAVAPESMRSQHPA